MLEYIDQNPILAVSLLVGAVFALLAVIMGLVLTRAHAKSRMGKRIAMATSTAAPGAAGGVDKRGGAKTSASPK